MRSLIIACMMLNIIPREATKTTWKVNTMIHFIRRSKQHRALNKHMNSRILDRSLFSFVRSAPKLRALVRSVWTVTSTSTGNSPASVKIARAFTWTHPRQRPLSTVALCPRKCEKDRFDGTLQAHYKRRLKKHVRIQISNVALFLNACSRTHSRPWGDDTPAVPLSVNNNEKCCCCPKVSRPAFTPSFPLWLYSAYRKKRREQK